MAKTKGSPKTLQARKKKARKPTTKNALEPGKKKMPEGKKNAPAKCNCKLPEGTPICSICLESLEKDLQPAHVTPIPGPSTRTSDLGGVVALRCGHVFHRVCVKPLIAAKRQRNMTSLVPCPCCRKEIKGPGDMKALFISFREEDMSNLEDSTNKCRRKNCVKFKKEAEVKVESLNDSIMLQRSQARYSLNEKQRLESEIEHMREEVRSSEIRRKRMENEVERLRDDICFVEIDRESFKKEVEHLRDEAHTSDTSRKRLEKKYKVSESARLDLEREKRELTSLNERLRQQVDLKTAQQDQMAETHRSRIQEMTQRQEAELNQLHEESIAFYNIYVRRRRQ